MPLFADIVRIVRRGKGRKRRSNQLTKAIAKQQALEDIKKEQDKKKK